MDQYMNEFNWLYWAIEYQSLNSFSFDFSQKFLSLQNFLIFNDCMAVVLFEFVLPSLGDASHQFGLNHTNNRLEWTLWHNGEFHWWFKFSHQNISIIFYFCIIGIGWCQALFSESFIRFLDFLVMLCVFPAQYDLAFFELIALINQHQVLKIFQVKRSHLFNLFWVPCLQVIQKRVHSLSEFRMTHHLEIFLFIILFRYW